MSAQRTLLKGPQIVLGSQHNIVTKAAEILNDLVLNLVVITGFKLVLGSLAHGDRKSVV